VVDRQAAAEEAKAKKAEQQASDDEMMAERKERKDKCSMYQERLTRYTQNRRLYRQDENGERVYLDEDQMANVRAETEQKVQEYCNNS